MKQPGMDANPSQPAGASGGSADRRHFLITGMQLALVSILAPWRAWARAADRAAIAQPFDVRLLATIGNRKSAAVIGAEYLRRFPSEAQRSRLIALLLDDLAGSDALESAPTRRLRHLLHRRSRWDFEAGRVVELHGWMLSITEARLYALATLS